MTEIRCTLAPRLTSPGNLLSIEKTFDELVAVLESETSVWDDTGSKDKPSDLPLLLSVAEWKEPYRAKSNVGPMGAIFLADFDGLGDYDLSRVLESVATLNVYLYTSWNHKTAYKDHKNCIRLIIELDREYAPEEHETLFAGMNVKFHGLLDPQTKDPSRGFYLPAIRKGFEDEYMSHRFEGEPLNVYEVLALAPPPEPKRSSSPVGATHVSSLDFYATIEEWAQQRKSGFDNKKLKQSAKIAKAILDGRKPKIESGKGQRHGWMLTFSGYLAREWPHADPEQLCYLLEGIGWDHFQNGATEKEHGISKLVEMVTAAQKKHVDKLEASEAEAEERLREEIRRASFGERDVPLTEEEEANLPEHWRQSLILIYENKYLFMKPNGSYHDRFYSRSEFIASARDHLMPYYKHGVWLEYFDDKGNTKRKSMDQVLVDYATTLEDAFYDRTLNESKFDPATRVLSLPCCIPQVEPVYHQDVQDWLEFLGGDLLVDMTSGMSRLGEMLPALVMTGTSGAGKTIYALGVGRIWGSSPAEPKEGHGDYNAKQILKQPVIFHDEKPGQAYIREGTTLVRRFVTESERVLNEKYTVKVACKGFGRLIFACNDLDALFTEERMTAEDKEALGQRLVHIEARPEHAKFCEDNLSTIQKKWIRGNALAQHFYWLGLNWEIKNKGERFLVSTSSTNLHKGLAGTSSDASDVLYWLLCYLDHPDTINSKQGVPIVFEDRRLRVNAKALVDNWSTYLPQSSQVLRPRQIGGALSGISLRHRQKIATKVSGKVVYKDAYEIDPDELLAANQRLQVLTQERLAELLGKGKDDES